MKVVKECRKRKKRLLYLYTGLVIRAISAVGTGARDDLLGSPRFSVMDTIYGALIGETPLGGQA